MQTWKNIKSHKVISGIWLENIDQRRNKTRMFTFLHDIAKPLAEISKMRLQPLWPTKIILRLLAANLSTTANQLSATSVLIQQNQHGDCKKNDMASFAEALFKPPTKWERNLLWVYIFSFTQNSTRTHAWQFWLDVWHVKVCFLFEDKEKF